MLPSEVSEYLSDSRNLTFAFDAKLEVTRGSFYKSDDIVLKEFSVDSATLYSNGLLDHYPKEWRAYEAYDLIQFAEGYSPEGILVWFPELRQFGTCDTDHSVIIVFPEVTWSQLIDDLMWYVNAQWFCDNRGYKEIRFNYLNPWKT